MKILGIPIIYVVIAVGVLGIVTYSYVSYNKPAFIADDTLKCQRTYDFSQVKFTTEAKQDWDKCYMPQPLYERRQNGLVTCLDYPEESCNWCAGTIALKYNNTNYCELMRACHGTYRYSDWAKVNVSEIEEYIQNCKNFISEIPFEAVCYVKLDKSNVNSTLIIDKQNEVYPDRDKRFKQIENELRGYCS